MSHVCDCRVVVVNRWVYMKTSVLRKLVGDIIPWFVPRYVVTKMAISQAHGQGMGRHKPEELQHLGRLDLRALRVILGRCL